MSIKFDDLDISQHYINKNIFNKSNNSTKELINEPENFEFEPENFESEPEDVINLKNLFEPSELQPIIFKVKPKVKPKFNLYNYIISIFGCTSNYNEL
jgi:hypothetical protein